MRRVPVLPLGSYLPTEEVRCEEISHVLLLLDFMKRADTRVSASAALEWHDKYSELYPDADNLEVLIAQRARLYPEAPSVYDGQLTVSFEGNDEYPKAIIRRTVTVDSGTEREQTPDHPLDHLPVFRSDSPTYWRRSPKSWARDARRLRLCLQDLTLPVAKVPFGL
ncbi:hypothetical protein K438DRAFT_1749514 [Mycena galopus ATCC 62051]|nr:hypothetical protein K438DRAFT_1749514 [Mycena galopus ATCC 62051]